MQIKRIAITKLNPAAYNPRKDLKPGDPEYEKLKRSLTEFGCVEPLVWNERTGNLVGGHQRLKVLIDQGASEADVSVVDLPLEKEKALNIALNKISGDWHQSKLACLLDELTKVPDFDIGISGFELPDVQELLSSILAESQSSKEEDFDVEQELEKEGPAIAAIRTLFMVTLRYQKRIGLIARSISTPAVSSAENSPRFAGQKKRLSPSQPKKPMRYHPSRFYRLMTLARLSQPNNVLDLADVTGKRIIATRLHHSVTIREENATAALEVMSRFAVNPKWLIYLPPTMSPTETTDKPGLLEHPQQAFDYFRNNGIGKVICEEKHMGSRAVVVICKDEAVANKRFGIREESAGIIYTRTGRRFFDDAVMEKQLLDIIRRSLTNADYWTEFATDWFCLDCELMPWSAKAQELLRAQYAAVGSASRFAVVESVAVLEQASHRYAHTESAAQINSLLDRERDRLTRVKRYVDAYRQYCWPVRDVSDLKIAAFHLLASEGKVHVDRDHAWHMQTLGKLAEVAPNTPMLATAHKIIDVTDLAEVETGIAWWEQLTSRGGEGMVVKPLDFIVRGKKGLVQPAVKCRGSEYLRIIYGPEYDAPDNLERLHHRGLGAKRSLAIREFALGIEALERFVRREPLRRVHECVFGVLALESEPVDPRL